MMKRETKEGETLIGNNEYEGFCVDMLAMIAKKVGFKYEIHIVKDGNYGSDVDGEWNGMVGELIREEADLAVAPLTITFVREQVIDFSKPFMHLGITILYRVPEPQNPGVFSFLNPLSFDIWMYVVMAYLVVSLTLFLLARFSPYEWYNEHPCNPEYDGVENQFNFLSCLWFAFGGLMQQGSEVNPRAFSTRVLSGFWWFFSLILVSSYTANLAAFLTVERMVSPITNADELAAQTAIEYGTRAGGSTATFFNRSKIDVYRRMWEFMSAREGPNGVFVETYEKGVERVLDRKNYALLIESSMAEYRVSQNCANLTQIGGLLNSRGYGIGTQQGSPLRDQITNAILQLQEEDEILSLKNKWWRAGHCPTDDSQKDNANELGLQNIGGIFIVLTAGLIMGIVVAVGEFVWKTRQNADREEPYLMKRTSEGGETLHGNDAYEGFCVDMLAMIAKKVGFNYKIHIVGDSNYGSQLDDGSWNGMVGELINDVADIAVAPLTISYVREKVIDFSKPYMHLGITILYRVPEPQNPGVFSFLNPLSFDIWMYVVMAYLIVSLTLFILARFSPYEWFNEHPCNPEYDGVENQFNLFSCLWFAFGSLMQQGSEVNPRAFSTRVLSGFWWFFSLILVSSYTANLAAFLTVERMVSPIKNADDLSSQTAIEYGTRSGGSTETFFNRSDIPTYNKMWEFMAVRPDVFTPTYQEGINRVLKTKNYAYLMESTMAEFVVSKHCQNLTQIGGLLNSRGYGIGTRQGDPIRDQITSAILQLQEADEILALKNRWWRTGICTTDDGQKDEANELGLQNIGGIFLVLIAGLVLGIMVACGEFVWKSRENAKTDRKSLCSEMMAEIRFACRCKNKKSVRSSIDHTKFMPSPPYPSGLNGQTFGMCETLE